jgi:hypothetical protein
VSSVVDAVRTLSGWPLQNGGSSVLPPAGAAQGSADGVPPPALGAVDDAQGSLPPAPPLAWLW